MDLGHEIFRLLLGTRLGPSVDQYPWLLIENLKFNSYLGTRQRPWSLLPFFKKLLIFYFYFLATLHGMQSLSSSTRYQTHAEEALNPNPWTARENHPSHYI